MIDVLASYAVGESLARLPLGELRAATQAGRPDRLAMLLVAPDLARELSFEGALRREAAGLRLARVPHLAPLVEVGRRDATLYVVFERPEGRTLADRLAAGEAFAPEQTTRLLQTVADALDAMHRRGLVHGLVAPETIFVSEDGRATLLGAGLLAAVDEAGLGDAIGGRVNLAFVAPEQVSGGHTVASADGYALGALAHLLLLGAAPPDAVDDADPSDDLAAGAVSAASEPFARVVAVLRRQLNARPERRYPSGAEFARALAGVLAEADLPPVPTAVRAAFEPDDRANGSVVGPPRPAVTAPRPVPAVAETPPPAPPTTTTPAPEPGQPSTRLRPMSPALAQGVRRMRATGDSRFLLLGLGVLVLGVICIGGIGLAQRTWWALAGLPIFGFLLAIVAVGFVWQRRAFANDLRIGQIREVIGPARVERTEERRPSHYLCLHDGRRVFIDTTVYDRLVRLGQKDETKPGFWARLLPKTVHRIDWLTAILLPASDLIVEVRDIAGCVLHREPDLRGISLDG